MADERNESRTTPDGFWSLEELENRIQGIAEQIAAARQRQESAEKDAARAAQLLAKKESEIERLTAEAVGLRTERRQVRERIQALLKRIESL